MSDTVQELIYLPAPESPREFNNELLKICGLAPNNKPYLRFVWGMDATETWGNREIRRYNDPEGVYVGLPFWILEGYQSPDCYDAIEWKQNADVLGEFPHEVWDYIEVLQTEEGEYLPLGERALFVAKTWRHWKTKPIKRVIGDLLEVRSRKAARADQIWQEKQEKIYAQFETDFARAVHNDQKKPEFSLPSLPSKYKQTASGLIVPK